MNRPEPIAWNVAKTVAKKTAAKEPFSSSYLLAPMQSQFDFLTAEAEELVIAETGLVPANGSTIARVVDRGQWAEANVAAMRRLLGPSLSSFSRKKGLTSFVGRNVTGAELGAVLGWMSSRVLGQYDPLIDSNDSLPQDVLYYVAPNILSLEKRFAFPPEEFRLWVAIHECTHRMQFTGVPWLVDYFKEQVGTLTALDSVDPQQISTAVRKAVKGESSDDKNLGMLASVVGPEQQDALQKMMGLMSLLEGHGEVVMSQAGGARTPNADRFHRVMHERRKSAQGLTKLVQRLLGMDAKLKQYAQGAAFIRKVESAGGRDLFDQIWSSPESLPAYKEIADPDLWINRMSRSTF